MKSGKPKDTRLVGGGRIACSFLWSFLEQGGSKLVQIVVQIVLARLVAPEAFGLLAVLLVVTSVADSVAQSGFGMALIQKNDADDASYDTAFWLSMGIAAALYAALFLAAPSLALFYGMPGLSGALRVLSLVVLFNSANSIQRSYMQRRMDFKGLFRATLSASAASGVVGVGAALAGGGIWALVAQALSLSAFTCAAMAVVVPWRPHFRFRGTEAKELFRYGWKICVTGILNVFYTGVSELVLGKACSAAELGYYSQGRKYPNAGIGVATNAIANVLFPAFADAKGDPGRLHARIRRGLAVGTFVMAPLSMMCAAAAEPLVVVLLGEAWLPCVPVFALACAGNAISMLQLVNLRAYMALGRSDLYMKLQVVKVALGVALIGGASLATHDVYATAWATFLVGVFNFVAVDMAPAGRVHGYGRADQIRDVAPTLFASLVAYAASAAVALLSLGYAAELLLQCAAYAVVYFVLAKLMRISALGEVFSILGGLFEKRR